MHHARTDRTAYLVVGGIATLGVSLDAGESTQQGDAMRGKVGIAFGVACAGLS